MDSCEEGEAGLEQDDLRSGGQEAASLLPRQGLRSANSNLFQEEGKGEGQGDYGGGEAEAEEEEEVRRADQRKLGHS